LSAGFTPVVIENVFEGDELRTDVAAVEAKLRELGVENVLAVVTTTSCFAPRGIDRIADVGRLCAELDVGHVVNNAYGLQSKRCCNLISEAMVAKDGRLDAFVSSTDKNFCVPVGGSCVVSPSKEFIVAVGRAYPGRASIAPLLDVLITMLHWGRTGYATLLRQREELMPYLRARLEEVAAEAGERVLDTPHNPISMGLTLDAQLAAGADRAALTEIGAMLFKRNISGCRVVVPGAEKEIEGHSFVGYGGHTDAYPHAYITAACSIGLSRDDVDSFTKTLSKTLSAFRKKKRGGEVE
jgi:O-phospho-L-seryl-tRNASec:L-selenocysteinyl-tRNA synthase|tara:strand:- start:1370 stop:2260 length:891 start_codon:yes stop_codon:yes gene_type:complete